MTSQSRPVRPDIFPRMTRTILFCAAVAGFTGLAQSKPADSGSAPPVGVLRETVPMDMEMVKAQGYFGYTPDYVQKYFTMPRTVEYDFTGVDRSRFHAPPKPGVHPRVLFNPDEVPAIRSRLETTKPGKLINQAIRSIIAENLTGPSAKFAAQYDALANGDESVPIHKEINIPFTLLYEAFRALIDNDEPALKKAAAAVTTVAKIDQKVLEQNIATAKEKKPEFANDFETVGQGATQEGTLGLMYDFTYNAMTPEQRDVVRGVIAKSSAGMRFIGCETLRCSSANSSNHIPWIARLIYLPTSIEGEPGYDEATYKRCLSAMHWFYAIGLFPSGDAYEGWGKNFIFAEHAWILARRGDNSYALSTVRNGFRNYFLQAMNPWGGAFTFYDSLGGTGNKFNRMVDVLAYKAMFPGDPSIDFVYRNIISPDYKEFGGKVNTRHPFLVTEALGMALFAAEYDESQTWEQAQAKVTQELPLTFWCEDTCNMIARSSWDKDALYLNYLNRAVSGGHLYSDRGHFSLYSHGRYWGIYKPMRQEKEAYQPMNRTGVLVDGDGVSVVPGKCVMFSGSAEASFIATDLKPSYDYISNYIFPNTERKGSVKLPFCPNDFRLHPSPYPWMNIQLDEMPFWLTSRIPVPAPGEPIPPNPAPGAWWRKRPVPFEKAFRTVGMVRGTHPYVLVIDDINRDKAEHDYSWGMTLADDVVVQKTEKVSDPQNFRADCILGEKGKDPATSRALLVRMVSANNLVGEAPASIEPVASKNPPMADIVIPKLTFHSKSVEPNFKALLFAYQPGEKLPETRWSADGKTLTVAWDDQKDEILFGTTAEGRSSIRLHREGSPAGNFFTTEK